MILGLVVRVVSALDNEGVVSAPGHMKFRNQLVVDPPGNAPRLDAGYGCVTATAPGRTNLAVENILVGDHWLLPGLRPHRCMGIRAAGYGVLVGERGTVTVEESLVEGNSDGLIGRLGVLDVVVGDLSPVVERPNRSDYRGVLLRINVLVCVCIPGQYASFERRFEVAVEIVTGDHDEVFSASKDDVVRTGSSVCRRVALKKEQIFHLYYSILMTQALEK